MYKWYIVTVFDQVKTARILGDRYLQRSVHIDALVLKLSQKLVILKYLKKYATKFHSNCIKAFPHDCITVWVSDKVQCITNTTARIITRNLCYDAEFWIELLKQLGSTNWKERRDYFITSLVLSIAPSPILIYLGNRLNAGRRRELPT